LLTEPAISEWSPLVASPTGELFGKTIASWRSSVRIALGLPDKPIIVVGHQPEFFHPGILAKFVSASQLAKQIEGVLVHLVVDHHIGNSGVLDVPDDSGRYLSTKQLVVAKLDSKVAMKDQPRATSSQDNVFSNALVNASGDNAAMQFANATDDLMKPLAQVDHCIAGTSLLQTELAKAILEEMRTSPEPCITAYNNAVASFPECGILPLEYDELPLWIGPTNERLSASFEDLRPRALLLTLLARLVMGDLMVHGTGGFAYDRIMEKWALDWLHVVPCNKTMATTTLTLPLQVQTIEQARREYFSAPKHFLNAINNAPYGSSQRQLQYLAMHKWLEENADKPDIQALKKAQRIATRRDWAFPLYGDSLTKDFGVAKSAEVFLSNFQ